MSTSAIQLHCGICEEDCTGCIDDGSESCVGCNGEAVHLSNCSGTDEHGHVVRLSACGSIPVELSKCSGTNDRGEKVLLSRCGAYNSVLLSNCSGNDEHGDVVRLGHCSGDRHDVEEE